ncbi:hypothetical protein BH18ACT15_BH18ACT15_07460 [soil metagenome]
MTVGPRDDRSRARQILHGGEEHARAAGDEASAEKAAHRILEESEERTNDKAAYDPEDDDVIRRGSEETAVDP